MALRCCSQLLDTFTVRLESEYISSPSLCCSSHQFYLSLDISFGSCQEATGSNAVFVLGSWQDGSESQPSLVRCCFQTSACKLVVHLCSTKTSNFYGGTFDAATTFFHATTFTHILFTYYPKRRANTEVELVGFALRSAQALPSAWLCLTMVLPNR